MVLDEATDCAGPDDRTTDLSTRGVARVDATYRTALTGLAAAPSAAEAEALRADPRVLCRLAYQVCLRL